MSDDTAIIIPAYNEAATIAFVIQGIKDKHPDITVIVVNDTSTDNTADAAEQAGAVVVNHTHNKGYDGALNSGFLKAHDLGVQYAITFDADGQHDATLIADYIETLHQGYDLVLGIRPQTARLSEALFAHYARIRFGIHDPLCGMKGYNMKLYQALGHFDDYESIGTELTFFALKHDHPYKELEIPIHERVDNPRFASLIRANLKIFRVMLLSMIH